MALVLMLLAIFLAVTGVVTVAEWVLVVLFIVGAVLALR